MKGPLDDRTVFRSRRTGPANDGTPGRLFLDQLQADDAGAIALARPDAGCGCSRRCGSVALAELIEDLLDDVLVVDEALGPTAGRQVPWLPRVIIFSAMARISLALASVVLMCS